MKTFVLERTQIINQSLADTFDFYCDAFNLEKITPPFLRFKILAKPPLEIRAGTLIDYSLSLFGIPFKWQTLIEAWEPGVMFVDRQLKGPYRLWVHTHKFEALDAGRTKVTDIVEYQLPMGLLGEIAHELFVKKTLNQIFDYRANVTARLLNSSSPSRQVFESERKLADRTIKVN